jgi:integrase family protein with SAM-like domain
MTAPQPRLRLPEQPRQLDAGPLEPLIGSFALYLAAEGKAARTVQGYTSAVRWFAAGYLLGQPGKTSWEQVDAPDIQRWMTQLLGRYSGAYASIRIRALRQFFKWQAGEEQLPDPMARLRAPKVTVTGVPVFRAASPGPSRSAIRRPAASTATCGPGPGTPRRTGLSCGSA